MPANRRNRPIARKPPAPPADPPSLSAPPRKRPGPRAAKPVTPIATAAPPKPGTPRKKAAVAGPAPAAAAKREHAGAARLAELQRLIETSLEDDKAVDVVTLDLEGRATFADRMVIATGLADRQITAMATHLEEKLHEAGVRRVQTEGAAGADWVLIDAGDIVVHLFKPDARAMYALERMWGPELDEAPAGSG